MKLDVEFDASRAQRWLDGIGRRLDQPTGLLDALVDHVHDYESDVFATSGFGAWPGLADGTLRQKSGSRVLVDRGDLFDALTSDSNISGDDLLVAAEVDHAIYHARGTGRMPRRDPAPDPQPGVVVDWAETLLDEIIGGVR